MTRPTRSFHSVLASIVSFVARVPFVLASFVARVPFLLASFVARVPFVLASCAAIAILATPLHAQTPVETFEYTVEAGDSCGGIAQRFYGAWRRYGVILRFNPQLAEGAQQGACGPFLRPGVVLVLPRVYVEGGPSTTPTTPDPDARVTRTIREVQAAEPESRDWQRARSGLPLWRGWRVNTLERAAADVTFRDASRISLRENTLIVIYGGESLARRETSRATLERGQLRSRLSELRMQVDTPSGSAELASGSALVGVDEEGTTRVSNFEGAAASVRGEQGRVAVREGFGSKVIRNARPMRPRPLPPAPAWSEGPRRFVGVTPYGATITGAWRAVEVARRYRVEIVNGEGDPVAATEVPAEVTHFELHRFPEGAYRVRVSTIDGDFFESRPSEAREIEVALGGVDVPTDEVLPDPSEEPTPPTVMLGARFVAPGGARCALASATEDGEQDGERERAPVETLVLTPIGLQEVHCVDAEGHATGRLVVDVRAPELTIEVPTITRGEAARVVIRSASPLPEGLRVRGEGVDVPLISEDGAWVATLDTNGAPPELSLSVVAGEVVLAETSVVVSEAPSDEPTESIEVPEEEEPVVVSAPAPFAVLGHPDLTALDDAPGDPFALSLGFGSFGDHPLRDAHLRVDAAISATVAERVRASVGLTRDFVEVGDRAVPRGDGDVRFELDATSRFSGPWRVGGGASLFAPSGEGVTGARSLGTFRVGGHVDLDRALGTFVLRTRQAMLVDTDAGLRAWASTYGAGWAAHPNVSLGAEVQLTFGRDSAADEAVVLATLGVGAELRLGGMGLVFGARVGLSDDTWRRVGALTLAAGWVVRFE